MPTSSKCLLVMLSVFFATNCAPAQVIFENRFETGTDGWLASGDATESSNNCPLCPNVSTGCEGLGILIFDANDGGDQFFEAPNGLLKGMARAYGGTLSFDIRRVGTGDSQPIRDVMLYGEIAPGQHREIRIDLPTPGPTCVRRDLSLRETGGWRIGRSEIPPTRAEFESVLATLQSLRVRAEYSTAVDQVYLDNVVLTTAANSPCVTITQHPRPAAPRLGQSVHLFVDETHVGPNVAFQWRKNDVALAGAQTQTLTINQATAADSGNYDCVISNSCGSVISSPALVSVSCPADLDNGSGNGTPDGGVTIDDLLYFLQRFENGC